MGLNAMVLTYKLQDFFFIKVSINNFQSFMMSLVRDIFSDAHSENCYYNKAPQKETELTFYIQCVIANNVRCVKKCRVTFNTEEN